MSSLARSRPVAVVAENDGSNAIEVVVQSSRPDLGLVDALARLQLIARRHGCSIRVRPCDELRELLLVAGLAEVLALEPRRETERGIQLGIEEVVQPGDPPT
ncbi:MAG: hypothetical protein QOI95_3261 [Acidimicrobiaceae bacterium]